MVACQRPAPCARWRPSLPAWQSHRPRLKRWPPGCISWDIMRQAVVAAGPAGLSELLERGSELDMLRESLGVVQRSGRRSCGPCKRRSRGREDLADKDVLRAPRALRGGPVGGLRPFVRSSSAGAAAGRGRGHGGRSRAGPEGRGRAARGREGAGGRAAGPGLRACSCSRTCIGPTKPRSTS